MKNFSENNFLFLLFSQNATNLERFQLAISKREMYPDKNRIVDNLLQDMVDLPIQHVGEFYDANLGSKSSQNNGIC